MELRDIKAFISVANHSSFTKAAEHSFLSQPTLSKSVRKLEDNLKIELLDRSTRHLRLTDAGEIVYKQGQQALASLNELPFLLNELIQGVAGEIKIGIPPLIGTLFFPQIARSFHTQYPNVKLELVELGSKLIEQLVEEGQIDIGLIVLPADESAFNVYSYFSDEFALYVHKDHPLAARTSIALSELKDEQFIIFSKDFTLHDYVINACKEAGFNPTISYMSSQWDLILELVTSKLGITLLPKVIFEKQNSPVIKTIPLQAPSLQWNLVIVTKKNTYQSFALKNILQLFVGSESTV